MRRLAVELPYEECREIDGFAASISAWTTRRFTGVAALQRMLGPAWAGAERIGDHKKWPTSHYEPGFWMAAIWSPRIPDVETFDCGCAYGADHAPKPADPDCRWCHGKPHERSMGITWGLHAVVMKGSQLVWDPHPDRDDSAPLYFRSATTWQVTDPACLHNNGSVGRTV